MNKSFENWKSKENCWAG